mmetsp:Transcript_10164/g.11413  ORF Transcript_10164/g.11413 Transcript_10164/m.11413 type:complete len:98 (+) Transcript_10164:246-539(+)
MLKDPQASKEGSDGPSYLGDMIAFLGAGAGALMNVFCSKNSKSTSPIVTMANSFIFSSLTQLMLFPLFLGYTDFYSMDPVRGAFGWLSDSYVTLLML